MDLLPTVFSSGWASGVNCYLVVLVLGVADRTAHLAQVPDVFDKPVVIAVAAVLFALEFVTDKIPYVDSTWDSVSTVIRPLVGAAISVAFSQDASTLSQVGYGVLGGGTALASHAVKAGSRLAINTTPEPVSNIAASLSEDLTVLGVVLLVIHHPWIALSVTATLLVLGLVLLVWLLRKVRRGWRRWKGRPLTSPG